MSDIYRAAKRDQERNLLRTRIAALKAENERLKQLEDAVYAACFDHNSVDMSGKVRWARSVPVSSVLRHIFDAYGSKPLTPDGTVPREGGEE